jgi:hypothetical protein
LEGVDTERLTADEWLLVRARVGNLTADFNEAVTEVDDLLGTTGAQNRILRYLRIRLGEKVNKEDLSGVGGIHEWARRVRELREDHGWAIHTANTRGDLAVGEYILELDRPDPDLARGWMLARQMRDLKTAGGAAPPKFRVLEFLKRIHPRAVDREQVAHVAGSSAEASRAVDELRSEGWQIATCPVDDPLTPGGWRLASRDEPGA